MKRIIAALAFSALAAPALADNRPFEQVQLDRSLPEISAQSASTGGATASPRNPTFEQAELDRVPPHVADRRVLSESPQAVTSFEQYNAI